MGFMTTGGDIDTYCSKCKLALAHVIIAMDGQRVLRVECKTCKGVHMFRKDAQNASGTVTRRASPKAAGTPARSRSKTAIGPTDYDKVMRGHDVSRAQRYRATLQYHEGDVLDHVTFGIGMVTRLLADAKIEVVFPLGTKVLVHSRAAKAS